MHFVIQAYGARPQQIYRVYPKFSVKNLFIAKKEQEMENTKDRFYVDLQSDTIEWMYYNPDSDI